MSFTRYGESPPGNDPLDLESSHHPTLGRSEVRPGLGDGSIEDWLPSLLDWENHPKGSHEA